MSAAHRPTRSSVTVPELVAAAHDRGELSQAAVFALPFPVWRDARQLTTALEAVEL